jgi:hypothetical protein
MSSYWVTFRIADRVVNGRTYDVRYEALKDAIKRHASKWWLEPTSFIAFSSANDIGAISAACKAAIVPQYDMFLIRKMDEKSAIICGANEDRDIYEMMPYLKSI